MADKHRNPLYQWERKNPVRTHSRSQRVTTDTDISSWLKKVEDASNIATAEAFGVEYGTGAKLKGRSAAKMTTDQVRHHEAAYSEAQDLLNQWMSEKVNFDSGLDFDDGDYEDLKFKGPTRAEVKHEWDNLVDIDELPLNLPKHLTHKPALEYDLINQDESEIVDTILHNMLNKEVVNDDFKNDLGLEKQKNAFDPRTKMTLRHQQVRENREKREKQLEKKRREQQLQKEARSHAKQIVMKEEQAKEMKKKKEEEEVQKEMMKIRRELDEQRKREEEERFRKRKDQEEIEEKTRLEEEQLQWEEQQREILERRRAEERRREVLKRLQQIEAQNAANNYKLMQKCFSTWYGVVLERRRQTGKARAMSDWKCLLRAWNAWKAYTRARNMDRDALEHEEYLRDQHRKSQSAHRHYCSILLRKCFTRWQVFIESEKQEISVRQDQNTTRSKMSAFLDAAASGKLWQKKENLSNTEETAIDSSRQKVDKLFENIVSQPKSGPSTVRSDCTTDRTKSPWKPPPLTKPKEAWQVTRKHVNLSPEEINSLTAANGISTSGVPGSGDSSESSPSHKKKPWEKAAPSLGTFENRHQAQQKILKEQQQQLKEQKRLIEELQYLQKQQILQQQLHQQQLLSKQLNNQSQPQSLQEIQALIKNLQKNINIQEQQIAQDKNEAAMTIKDLESDGTETARTCTSVTTTSSNNAKHDEFLKGMEQRATQRARLKAEREEKKQKAEEEKLARIQAEEEERQKIMEEEKKARIEARKEQKRLEKQREEEKRRQFEKVHQQLDLADNHYKLSILKYKGLKPWLQFVEQCQQNSLKAKQCYEAKLLRRAYLIWNSASLEAVQHRENIADGFYKCLIIRRCFRNWKKYGQCMVIEEEKAERFYRQRLIWKVFHVWSDYAVTEKVRMWKLERAAKEFNSLRVVRTIFRTWKGLPEINKRHREKEAMRMEMRRKVASMLPDFRASDNLDGFP